MTIIRGKGYENVAFYEMDVGKTKDGEPIIKQAVEELGREMGDDEISFEVQGTIFVNEEMFPEELIDKIKADKKLEFCVDRLISAAIENPADYRMPAVRAYEAETESIAMFLASAITSFHCGACIIRAQKKKNPWEYISKIRQPKYKTVYYVYTLGLNHYLGQ